MGIPVPVLYYSCSYIFFPCVQLAAPHFSLLRLSPATYIIEESCSVVQVTSSGIGRFDTSKSSQNVGCSLKPFC